jgi:hypothetical protein
VAAGALLASSGVSIRVLAAAAAGLLFFLLMLGGVSFTTSSGCGGAGAIALPAPGIGGVALRGRVSWFGGPHDSMSGPTTASGLPVTQPGIAVYNTETLRGYWVVRFPNGRTAILRQTDIGPAPWTGRVLDVLYSAFPALGYTERNFPTDAQITARYLGDSPRYAPMAIGLGASQLPSGAAPTTPASACDDPSLATAGVPGKVVISPGANRPGVPTARITLMFVAKMATIAERQITISTGTNHSQFTVDGGISDHWDGHAADLGMAANNSTVDGPVGDRLMAACLLLGGLSPARVPAAARSGGLYTLFNGGLRIQCIWKTYAGGNHHDHVHVGVRPF